MTRSSLFILALHVSFLAICQNKKETIALLTSSRDSAEAIILEQQAVLAENSKRIENLEDSLQLERDEVAQLWNEEVRLLDSVKLLVQKIEEAEERLQFTKEIVDNHGRLIDVLQDSLSVLNRVYSKMKVRSEFTSGAFTEDETQFILNHFVNYVSNLDSDKEGYPTRVSHFPDEFIVHHEGIIGYVPSVRIQKNFIPELSGDLDADGVFEILFFVEVSGGGALAWQEMFCLKLFPNASYFLFSVDIPTFCPGGLEDRGKIGDYKGIQNGELSFWSSCYSPDDPDCCPSVDAPTRCVFKNDKLLRILD